MPSVRDAHSDMVYPQAPLDITEFKAKPGQVIAVGDPGTIRCNDVVIGCSSQDMLKHLSANECTNAKGEDRIGRLATHVIAQRSYYPLYPPPKGSTIDMSLMHAAQIQLLQIFLSFPLTLALALRLSI